MRPDETWENEEYRCQLCMQLFAAETTEERTPLIVCENVHNFCAKCCGELQTRELQGCPQCRVPLWPDAKPNRGFLGVLKKLRLPCGSCTSPLLMGCREAATHALECANSRIRCPMHTGVQGFRECQQDISCSRLWEHCHDCHNLDDNRQVHMLVASDADAEQGVLCAALSVQANLASTRAVFFIVQTAREAYRFCLHLSLDGGGRACAAVRRFFPSTTLGVRKILLGVEAGELCGLVTQLHHTLACHESMSDVLEAGGEALRARVAQVPLPLLAQMASDQNAPGVTVSVCVQMWFCEQAADA